MVGHETIAGSVALTTYALARNPEMQQKLRDELLSAGDITYESIQKLEYLDAIVKEGCVPCSRFDDAPLIIPFLVMILVSACTPLRHTLSASTLKTT